MKLSINNFKTIRELKDFSFNSINIISGVNSSGKTSFIQFLLLLKQTIEAQLANPILVFDGDLIKLGEYDSLVYKKDSNNDIEFEVQFNKQELKKNIVIQGISEIENLYISAKYSSIGNDIILKKIKFQYTTIFNNKEKVHSIEFLNNNGKYNVTTDTLLFGNFMPILDENNNLKPINDATLSFNSFIPLTLINEDIGDEIKTQNILQFLGDYFAKIFYIGPLRAEPNDFYPHNKKNKYIGKNGEYAAQFLEEEASNIVEFCPIQKDDTIGELKQISLSEAVKYWICDVFHLAKDITADKDNDRYIVKVINHYGVESTIRQVGFGISQVLPIIVEGLRMDKNGLLILEQPEIHLHPKVQSLLFDFIYSMSLTGKRFLIETHSDHFITRMRRRVAESKANLAEKINLVFVEQRETEHLFHKLNLDDMGTFDYFPTDFVEQTEDFGAIIMAQAKKAKIKQ
ncbi:MAG: AAA family ATPase [Bacteroidales bacterium]|jgi:predicted ATPase|nr:AAA family ATPase [Bacteroidales bacterium]